MDAKQKWNRIVALHKQYYKSPETTIQNVWENICVEILGFSRLEGEVDRHRNIYLGSTERVIPDVIVKDSKKDLFVIELKLHNAVFEDGMRRQLFSYLKQLKVNVGVLVCEKLYIYGYDYSKQDSEQLCVEIPFEAEAAEGVKFVELFSKVGFSEDAIQKYVYDQNKFELHVGEISTDLTESLVVDLIKKHFANQYTEEEINTVLESTSISVTLNKLPVIDPPKPVGGDDPIIVEGGNSTGMDKGKAINLLRSNGVSIPKKCTYSSLNKNGLHYWANPPLEVLKEDWWIILNDWKKRELHCLKVPAQKLSIQQISVRRDRNAVDLEIVYGSESFVDSRSKLSFKSWLVKTIKY